MNDGVPIYVVADYVAFSNILETQNFPTLFMVY